MCGILGMIQCGDSESLQRAGDTMRHRGPDDFGVAWFDAIESGLCHQRLSIIDLSEAGHQPLLGSDRRHWICFNGEIYNYQSIRRELEKEGVRFRSRSDTEVLLEAYLCWGRGCLDKLNGMFAFAILDSVSGELFAARDRSGIKPLYYWHQGRKLIVASEIKAILETGEMKAEPDTFALHTPTRFQIEPLTGFNKIYKLQAGHTLTFKNDALKMESYWDIRPSETSMDFEEAGCRLEELLSDATRLQMIADVPVGVFLSGGLDSSLISALMRKHTDRDIHAFTIEFSEKDKRFEKQADDAYYASALAKQFGFKHHRIELETDVVDLLPKLVWHMDEPLSDPAAINTYLICEEAKRSGIKVLLNGMGGDEVFGGYRKHLACLLAERYQQWTPRFLRSGIRSLTDHVPVASSGQGFKWARWGKRFFSFADLPAAERFLSADLSLNSNQYAQLFPGPPSYSDTHFYRSQAPRFTNNSLSYLTEMCWNDCKVMLTEHNLLYSDKASMAAGLESRPPLTDHRIIEFMFRLPPEFRIHRRTQKYLLKKVSERFVPRNIIYRPKAPFGAPLRSWVRGPLHEMIDDYLSPRSIKNRGLHRPQTVQSWIADDRKGLADNAYLIWTLLTQEIWFRTFFD